MRNKWKVGDVIQNTHGITRIICEVNHVKFKTFTFIKKEGSSIDSWRIERAALNYYTLIGRLDSKTIAKLRRLYDL